MNNYYITHGPVGSAHTRVGSTACFPVGGGVSAAFAGIAWFARYDQASLTRHAVFNFGTGGAMAGDHWPGCDFRGRGYNGTRPSRLIVASRSGCRGGMGGIKVRQPRPASASIRPAADIFIRRAGIDTRPGWPCKTSYRENRHAGSISYSAVEVGVSPRAAR